jgi:hypothetical protein
LEELGLELLEPDLLELLEVIKVVSRLELLELEEQEVQKLHIDYFDREVHFVYQH